jgi:hypothetical protein
MRGSRWVAVAVAAVVSSVPTAAMAAPMIIKAKTIEDGWVWRPKTAHITAPKGSNGRIPPANPIRFGSTRGR